VDGIERNGNGKKTRRKKYYPSERPKPSPNSGANPISGESCEKNWEDTGLCVGDIPAELPYITLTAPASSIVGVTNISSPGSPIANFLLPSL